LAASLERSSQHPLGAAVVEAAKDRKLPLTDARDFDAQVGKGVTGTVDGRHLVIGNARIMKEVGVDVDQLSAEVQTLRREGATTIFIAVDGAAAGVVAIADPIKSSTPGALAALRAAGIHVIMLTGDNAAAAGAVASKLGIGEVKAEVLPQDKSSVV